MRHTVLGQPSSMKSMRSRADWKWEAGRREVARDTRVMMRRESHALIAEAMDAEFEPPRDFEAEWHEAMWALRQEADDREADEFGPLWHFLHTGEMLPVE